MPKQFRKVLMLFGLAILGMGLLSACSDDGDDNSALEGKISALEAQVEQLEQAQAAQSEATLAAIDQVNAVVTSHGFATGIVGQRATTSEVLLEIRASLEAVQEGLDAAIAAAAAGGGGGSAAPAGVDARVGRDGPFEPFVIKLSAVGTFAIDDSQDPGSHGTVTLTITEGAGGTVYTVDQWVIEDGNFELRMGADAYWGYAAEQRIDSNAGDGIVLTGVVGDTISINRLRQSGSRATGHHNFTIEGLPQE